MPIYTRNNSTYSTDFKIRVVNYAKSHSMCQTGIKFGISNTTVSRWVHLLSSDIKSNIKGAPARRIAIYYLHHNQAETEKQFHISKPNLDTAFNSVFSFTKEKYRVIMNDMRIKKIAHTGLYNSIKQASSEFKVSQTMIKQYIKQVYGMSRTKYLEQNLATYIAIKYSDYAPEFFQHWQIIDNSELKNSSDEKAVECRRCGFKYHVAPKFVPRYADHCPNCNMNYASNGEKQIMAYLFLHQIKFIGQYRVKIGDELHLYDFYLPEQKLFIEYNGKQHYEDVDCFECSLITRQKRDQAKKQYASKHGNLLTIPTLKNSNYEKITRIAKILDKQLNLITDIDKLAVCYDDLLSNSDFKYRLAEIAIYSQQNGFAKTITEFNISSKKIKEARKQFLPHTALTSDLRSRNVVVRNVLKGEQVIFPSVIKTAEKLQCSPKKIYNTIYKKRVCYDKHSKFYGCFVAYAEMNNNTSNLSESNSDKLKLKVAF